MADPQALSEAQAARVVGVSAATMKRWRRLGRVTYYRSPGGRISYTANDLVDLRYSMRVVAMSQHDPV